MQSLKEIPQKVLKGCQKNLVHLKILYITRLRHLENHTEAVDLYLMNWHLNSLNIEWISVVSLSVIPLMIDLWGEFSLGWKMGLLLQTWHLETVARSPLNCQSHCQRNCFGHKVMLCVWWNFEGVIHWEFVPNGRAVDADLYSQQLERVHEILRQRYPALFNRNSSLAAGQCKSTYWMNNHGKNSGIWSNQTATTPSTQPWSCAFRLPFVSIQGPFLSSKKFRKPWCCGSGSHRILHIKNKRLVPSRDNKPHWKMDQGHRICWSLLWIVSNFLSENIPNKILLKKKKDIIYERVSVLSKVPQFHSNPNYKLLVQRKLYTLRLVFAESNIHFLVASWFSIFFYYFTATGSC